MPTPKQITTVALIAARFPELFGETVGDVHQTVTGASSPELSKIGEMSFLSTPKAFESAKSSAASVFVVPVKSKELAVQTFPSKTILTSLNPEKAMAVVISEFFLKTPFTNFEIQSVHPSAYIGENSRIAPSARIGPNAFIGANSQISEHVYIGANAVVEENCSIGPNTVIHPLAYIGHSTEIGARCEIHPHTVIGKEGFGYAHDEKFNHSRIPHQGRVVIEDDVQIGACVAIDRATFGETRIERGVIMDNLIHIAHNNRIGRNSILTSGFTIAGSSKIGANFVAGGKTVVTGHIEIADNVQVAALTAVSKSIPMPGQYGGNPLVSLQQHIKTKAALAHLPQMRKMLQKITKHLGLEDVE